MSFNREILYAPTGQDRIARFDILDPAAPVALADIDLGLDAEVETLAIFSNGDVVFIDDKNNRLVRVTPAGGVVWNVSASLTGDAPRQVLVDKNEAVWVGYVSEDAGVNVYNGASGALEDTVPDIGNAVLQGSEAAYVLAYDDVIGRVILIDAVSRTITSDFQVASKIADVIPVPLKQVGMISTKFFIPVKRTTDNKYIVLEFSGSVLLQTLPFEWSVALTGTLTDASGNILAMDEFSRVIRFLSTSALYAIYSLESQGRMSAMAFDKDGTTIFALTDDLFGEARAHSLNPSTGVATYVAYEGGAFQGGDLTGYQFGTVISDPDVPLSPPTFDDTKFVGITYVSDSITVLSGKPGSVTNATVVVTPLGNAQVNPSGSWSIQGSAIVAGSYPVTVTGPGGGAAGTITVDDDASLVPAALQEVTPLQSSHYGLGGGEVSFYFGELTVPIDSGDFYVSVLHVASGKYYDGVDLVPVKGNYIKLSGKGDGVWAFSFVPPEDGAGDYVITFRMIGISAQGSFFVNSVPEDVTEILSEVKKLGAPAAPFLEPANLLTDPTTIGGALFHNLHRIQFHLNILSFKAKVIFPKLVEGVAALITTTIIKTNDTPLLEFTIIDPATGQPKDLTGHTVWFRARTQAGGALIFQRKLEIIDAENGKASIIMAAEDTDTSGSFVAEVEDISAEGLTLTTDTFNFTINPDLT